MKIGGYRRTVLYEGLEKLLVLIRWPPNTRTKKHDHSVGGMVFVLAGAVFEIRNGQIQHYGKKSSFRETSGAFHIVGNCSENEEAVTLHIYEPGNLEMVDMPDLDIDTLLCNSSEHLGALG